MRVKHHYYYEAKTSLISFLKKNEIPYEISNLPESKKKLCTFDLYEDQEFYWQFRKHFFFLPKYDSIKSIEYSKQDIENAEWLTLRSMNTKVQWEYEDKAFTVKQNLPGSQKSADCPLSSFVTSILNLADRLMRQLQELPSQALLTS